MIEGIINMFPDLNIVEGGKEKKKKREHSNGPGEMLRSK